MLSPGDLKILRVKGIELNVIEKQLDYFKRGFPFICLSRAATIHDGILTFHPAEKRSLKKYFEQNARHHRIVKFVPASGAATRMFKPLFEFRQHPGSKSMVTPDELKNHGFGSVSFFFSHLEKFAFFQDLDTVLKKEGKDLMTLRNNGEYRLIIDRLLHEKGLNYSNLPKALLQFHRYPDGSRVAMEEHLVEAAIYARDEHNTSTVHFTLSPEHLDRFHKKVEHIRNKYELMFSTLFDVSQSVQKPSTDTIAVDMDNIPIHTADGTLLFRPAGHGALIENLNETDADIIFIKNIDNVVPDSIKESTFIHKKIIGGYLLQVREHVFNFLRMSEQGMIGEDETDAMTLFAREKLFICLPIEFNLFPYEKKITFLVQKLNRPIRVCGMVKNEGEPGGGPFWVKDRNGSVSLQIVETSQINPKDEMQKQIFDSSTHFNPVDIVCSIKDYRGNTFRLHDYVDESTGFISQKSFGGKNLKALELPGLWNGAMADWITVFVEVPVITFNPVKIINDLLRKEHQC
jgi:hypothetical protein